MFSTLYVLIGYNNYLNRTLKSEESIGLYMEYDCVTFENINFNSNDEINTEIILNYSDWSGADYVVVEEEGQIKSRWFVVDRTRIRGNQWKFTLRRDVIVDYWNIIKSAPCFIEKAMLSPEDPRIFNKENMSFNQIKTSEELLKDKTGCPWIVGYMSKGGEMLKGDILSNKAVELGAYQIGVPIEEWYDGYVYEFSNLSDYTDDFAYVNASSYDIIFKIKNKFKTGIYEDYAYYKTTFNKDGALLGAEEILSLQTAQRLKLTNTNNTQSLSELSSALAESLSLYIYGFASYIQTYFNDRNQSTIYNQLQSLNGKTIVDSNNKVYDIHFYQIGKDTGDISIVAGTGLYDSFSRVINKAKTNGAVEGTISTDCFAIENVEKKLFHIDLIERTDLEIYYELSRENKVTTVDAPYDIFCIPYGKIDIYDANNDNLLCTTDKDIAEKTMFALNANHPGIIYDIQILPYCPIQNLTLNYYNEIYVDNDTQYSKIMASSDDEMVGAIFHVPKGRFSFNIEYGLTVEGNAINKKVESECSFYRLCSPNYSSYFDFNLQKNGDVSYFNVDCEYKPFTPYIHVNPSFGGLYGVDFNDPRGLICAGDFSIAQIIDQWEQYQIQNKNFQNIFNRQIENMEVTNKYQRELDITNAIAGVLQGTVSGAATGLLAGGGNPITAAITGAAGLGASLYGGIRDIQINEALRNEAIDFAKDNFGYQLGNIQALPNTLARVSAFNNNNKLFPVLEYYTCTEVEKEALRNKIKYNGMTIMTIGKIEDFLPFTATYDLSYIKGQIIQLPLMADDFHIANTIAGEINKGIYIQGGISNG